MGDEKTCKKTYTRRVLLPARPAVFLPGPCINPPLLGKPTVANGGVEVLDSLAILFGSAHQRSCYLDEALLGKPAMAAGR